MIVKRVILDCSFYYHHADHLVGGNIDLDENGAILQVVDYYPFGSIRTKKNYSDYENKYLFGGKEQDSETNLQYFEARYYNNGIGRFNSVDRVFWEAGNTNRGIEVLQFPQKVNSYTYSINNPSTYNDLSGEYADVVIESWVAMGKFWYGVGTGNAQLQLEGQKGGPGAGKNFSQKTKNQAYQESDGKCLNCGVKTHREKQTSPTKSEADHAIAKADGGNNSINNAQNLCRTCNRSKGRTDSDTFRNSDRNINNRE